MSAARGRLLRSVLARTIRDQRRALFGFGIGLLGFALFLGAFYPTIRDQQEEFKQLLEVYPPAMREMFGITDMASAPGFIHAELFSIMAPLLFLVYAIGRASDLIAGEEERGALDVLLSHPVSRRRVLLEKAAGLAVGLLALAGITYLSIMLASLAMGMGIRALELGAEILLLLLLSYVFGALTLLVAAIRGRKGFATGIASAIAVVSYLLHSFGAIIDWLEGAQKASPYHYYAASPPLTATFEPWHALILAALALVFLACAVLRFERRDLAV